MSANELGAGRGNPTNCGDAFLELPLRARVGGIFKNPTLSLT